MPDDYTPRQIAIHEAGHFVFACVEGLGVPEQITVEPEVVGATMDDQVNLPRYAEGVLGHCARKLGAEEQMIYTEIRGKSLEDKVREMWGPSVEKLMTPKVVGEVIAKYRARRAILAKSLIAETVAGTAADAELTNGNGRLQEDDFKTAKDVAGLVVGENAKQFIEEQYEEAKKLCKGRYRRAIETVADRIQAVKTLREPELKALWDEVKGMIE